VKKLLEKQKLMQLITKLKIFSDKVRRIILLKEKHSLLEIKENKMVVPIQITTKEKA